MSSVEDGLSEQRFKEFRRLINPLVFRPLRSIHYPFQMPNSFLPRFSLHRLNVLALVLFVGLFVGMVACKKNGDDPVVRPGIENYFPMQKGHFVEYRVDSLVYDGFTGDRDTSVFFIKERIDTLWNDLEGEETAVIGRYRKFLDDSVYVLQNVFRANRSVSTAERLESNVRYIKLTLPFTEGSTWNSNAYNTESPTAAKYNEVFTTATLFGNTYNSTVLVTVVDEFVDGLYKSTHRERFAENVGMIERFIEEIDYQQQFPGGRRVQYRAIRSGVE